MHCVERGHILNRCRELTQTPTGTLPILQRVVTGTVERGDQRGRLIGFPTANVAVDQAVLESIDDGVFAGWFTAAGAAPWPSAISIGRRPTFYQDQGWRLVEVHLLDFDGDLYGLDVHVAVAARIRDQRAFPSMTELTAQLVDDIASVRRVLRCGALPLTPAARPGP